MAVHVRQTPHRDAAQDDGRLDDGTYPVSAAYEHGPTTFTFGKGAVTANRPDRANDPMVKTAAPSAAVPASAPAATAAPSVPAAEPATSAPVALAAPVKAAPAAAVKSAPAKAAAKSGRSKKK